MTQPTCSTCRFFGNPTPLGFGYCQRFPTYTEHHRGSWCGEHKPSTPVVTENLT